MLKETSAEKGGRYYGQSAMMMSPFVLKEQGDFFTRYHNIDRRFGLKRLVLIALALVLFVFTISLGMACDEGNNGNIVDDLGRAVSLEEIPERIVSLAPSSTELLFALGLADKVVGVTEYCDYPPEAAEKPKVGGFSTVDLEKVVDADPDLIFATSMHAADTVPALEDLGLTVVALAPETIEDILENVLLVGELTDTKLVARKLVNDMRKRIAAVTEKAEELAQSDMPWTLYVTWHDPIWTVGEGSITNELIELAGGINVARDIDRHGTIDLESAVARNPEVIIACEGHGSAEDAPLNWAQTNEVLAVVDARKKDRIYQVDADLATRPGPRIVEGLEWFAYFLHPELFEAPE